MSGSSTNTPNSVISTARLSIVNHIIRLTPTVPHRNPALSPPTMPP